MSNWSFWSEKDVWNILIFPPWIHFYPMTNFRNKMFVRSISRWTGQVSPDGRYGLAAPNRFTDNQWLVSGNSFVKMGHARPLFVYFRLFKQALHFLQQICKKCHSSIWCRDSNPRPSEHKSPPITSRPGLPPLCQEILSATKVDGIHEKYSVKFGSK